MENPNPDTLKALENALVEERCDKAEASAGSEIEEVKAKLLRVAADFENFRKRSEKDVDRAYASGVETALLPVLKIFDVMELAVKAAAGSEDVAAVRKGLDMVMAEFSKGIASLGVERIEDANGGDFDPAVHDAVMRQSSELLPEGKVIFQINAGYRLGGRVIKAAQVVVSSGSTEAGKPPA